MTDNYTPVPQQNGPTGEPGGGRPIAGFEAYVTTATADVPTSELMQDRYRVAKDMIANLPHASPQERERLTAQYRELGAFYDAAEDEAVDNQVSMTLTDHGHLELTFAQDTAPETLSHLIPAALLSLTETEDGRLEFADAENPEKDMASRMQAKESIVTTKNIDPETTHPQYEQIIERGTTAPGLVVRSRVKVVKQDEHGIDGEFPTVRVLLASPFESNYNLSVALHETQPREYPPLHFGTRSAGINLDLEGAQALRDALDIWIMQKQRLDNLTGVNPS